MKKTYTSKEDIHYLMWIQTLAFKAAECDLTESESKTIWIFISRVKNYINEPRKEFYTSRTNKILLNVEDILTEHLSINIADIPNLKDEYSKEEITEIKRSVTRLHKKYKHDEELRVWKFCQRFRFFKTGNRNKHKPSAKKLNYGKLVLAAYA